MVRYADVLLNISKKLKNSFPDYDIYIDNNGEEIRKSSFYIKVCPLTVSPEICKDLHLLNIYITYIDKVVSQINNLDVMSELLMNFRRELEVIPSKKSDLSESRFLPIIEKEVINENPIVFKMTIKYYDDNGEDLMGAQDELMEILHLNSEYSV